MPLPANIMSSVTRFGARPRVAECALQPIDLVRDETPPWGTGSAGEGSDFQRTTAIKFQYWPESMTDSKGSEWNPKPVPGGSHPIYQFSSGGERTLAFVAVFTTDTAPSSSLLANGVRPNTGEPGEILEPGELTGTNNPYGTVGNQTPLSGLQLGVRDVDIRSAVSWLRWFEYPTYGQDAQQRASEPAKALLVMPNTSIAHNGTDYITVIMTSCDVTYEAWFPNGFPRIVEITLEFKETVQSAERVQFHDRRDFAPAANIGTFLRASYNVG